MNSHETDVAIVGAGAAGLFAAIFASLGGARTVLLEKNRKTGVKILMSGGTRCNITQDTDWRGIASRFGGAQGRFLRFALASFTPQDVQKWFRQEGVPVKSEVTGKIFPVSDRALDVRDALVRAAEKAGVRILNGMPVSAIQTRDAGFLLSLENGDIKCRRLILTTGGQSYPGCGTTGDGYAWTRNFGHRILEPRPALVPLRIDDQWVRELSGVTIPDVGVRLAFRGIGKKGSAPDDPRNADRGSFLFTHKGCSGPVVLNVSRGVTDPACHLPRYLVCDWIPEAGEEILRSRLANGTASDRTVSSVLAEWMPRRLAAHVCLQAGIADTAQMAGLGRKRIHALVQQLKRCELAVHGTLGFAKAEVTAGGVALDEVDPQSMESRKVPGLFLAGEILDIDGPIGGYNFQAAWSTGRLAGISASRAD